MSSSAAPASPDLQRSPSTTTAPATCSNEPRSTGGGSCRSIRHDATGTRCGAPLSADADFCPACLYCDEDAEPWHDSWVPDQLVVKLARSRLDGPDELAGWLTAGFSIDEAIEWAAELWHDWDKDGYELNGRTVSLAELSDWKRAGFSARDTTRWHEWFEEPAEAATWRALIPSATQAADLPDG